MDTVHFDISAKYPPDAKDSDHPLMLRTLLEDSFKLTVHRESKDVSGYGLMVAKSGFKLKPVEPGGSSTNSEGGNVRTLIATKVSMPQLADFVARNLGEIVVDKTGIDGVYDLELHWSRDDQPSNDIAAAAPPTLFIALQETLACASSPKKFPSRSSWSTMWSGFPSTTSRCKIADKPVRRCVKVDIVQADKVYASSTDPQGRFRVRTAQCNSSDRYEITAEARL
jgi:hypothetical protein